MKNSYFLLAFWMFVILIPFIGCTQNKGTEIVFKKDKLIEVALLTIKPGKEKQFSEDYFSKAFPIGKPYEPRMIGRFQIVQKDAGNNPAQMLVFF